MRQVCIFAVLLIVVGSTLAASLREDGHNIAPTDVEDYINPVVIKGFF
jgi:hypothetical protein